jgi:enoyl-CoA hydratase
MVEREGRLLLVVINRPDVLNALRLKTFTEIGDVVARFREDAEAGALIITGAGDRAFCAGGDVKGLIAMSSVDALGFAEMAHGILDTMESTPKPIIAAVNGMALGAGCDLTAACDLVIASERASFGEPPTGLGITTPFGGTQRLPRLVGPRRAKQLFLTGESVDAETALRWGLANKVVKPEELLPEAKRLAERVLARAPIAVGYCKRLVNEATRAGLHDGDELEAELYAKCFDTEDKVEGMRAFLEKRKAVFKGR